MDRLETYSLVKHALTGIMDVTRYEFFHDKGLRLFGNLRMQPGDAMRAMQPQLQTLGFSAELQKYGESHSLTLLPAAIAAAPAKMRTIEVSPQLSLTMFILTGISAAITGVLWYAPPTSTTLQTIVFGLLYMLATLGVLGAHELGHFIVAKWRGEKTTLPLFFPLPMLSPGGTLGAVIIQTAPFKNRRHLLEIGIAGPLAGFLIAVPLLLIGLYLTGPETTVVDSKNAGFLGESLLTRTFGTLFFGQVYTSTTESLSAHPFVLGAWFGLLVTGVNLLPIGQLDGGHVAYALLGKHAKYMTYIGLAVMLILTFFVNRGWILMTMLLFLFGRSHPPVDEEETPLEAGHYLLAVVAVLLLILTFVPQPIYMLTGG